MAGYLCFRAKKSLGIDKRPSSVCFQYTLCSYAERAIVECFAIVVHVSPSQWSPPKMDRTRE